MPIPSPEQVGESLDGAIYDLPRGTALVIGAVPPALAARQPVAMGALTVRYAMPFIVPTTEAVIPGLFAAEKGGILVGREAWDFIQGHFQVHPRADVIGLRPDGQQAQVFLRELDFGAPVRVLAYDSPDATRPCAELSALVIGVGAPAVPDLLAQYLPVKRLDALVPPDSCSC